jgi:hypothetical protein
MIKISCFLLGVLLLFGCQKLKVGKCYVQEATFSSLISHVKVYKIQDRYLRNLTRIEYQVDIWQKTGWHSIRNFLTNAKYVEVKCPLGPWEKLVWMVVPYEDLCHHGFPEKCH